MPEKMSSNRDPFSRIDYRRFVAWESRIQRELPFLLETFGRPGPLPLLDVGCGTGEHGGALASEGYGVIGLDRSPAMLKKARAVFSKPLFVGGEMTRIPLRGQGVLGGALCLGNTLVNLIDDHEYRALFTALRRLLLPSAPFLIQIVNLRRIAERGIRHLPLNFRKTEEGEILYLRILDVVDENRIRFEILTLERRPPEGESRHVQSMSTILRLLREEELERLLGESGFRKVDLRGDYQGNPYVPLESHDVIAIAR